MRDNFNYYFIKKHLYVADKLSNIVNGRYYRFKKQGLPLTVFVFKLIKGIFYVLKTGCQWSCMPAEYGHYNKYNRHFLKWSRDGIFKILWKRIYFDYRKKRKYKCNLKKCSIDTTLHKNLGAREVKGRNPTDRGRSGTKTSTITDDLGVTVAYLIKPANTNDYKIAEETIGRMIEKRKYKSKLYADKGYSYQALKENIEHEFILMAPDKKNFKKPVFNLTSEAVNSTRNIIEISYGYMKTFKRLVIRYDKSITAFESWLLLSFAFYTNTKLKMML